MSNMVRVQRIVYVNNDWNFIIFIIRWVPSANSAKTSTVGPARPHKLLRSITNSIFNTV